MDKLENIIDQKQVILDLPKLPESILVTEYSVEASEQVNEFQSPMLFNKSELEKWSAPRYRSRYPITAQLKYDGIRCQAVKTKCVDKHGVETIGCRLFTREGNSLSIPHVENACVELFMDYDVDYLDGELYNHNLILHDIIGIAKKGDFGKQLIFMIYDLVIPNLEFDQRMLRLQAIDTIINSSDNLKTYLSTDFGIQINNYAELESFYHKAITDNYEGVMLCKQDSMYEVGTRCSNKIKLKPYQTSEFLCVDHYMNKGSMSNQSTLICQTEDGRKFHCKMQGTTALREEYCRNFETHFKNKMVTIQYRKLSKYGVPIELSGVAVRDYE